MLDTKNICNSLEKEGFFVVKDYINPTCCEDYIKILEKLYVKRQKNNLYTGNHEYKVMYNYFFEFPKLFNLLYSKFTHKIISNLIDNDYVLISAAARNRQLIGEVNNQILASGVGWHNDARYVNNKLIKPSFSYFTILALDSFTKYNGATQYVPQSHKKSLRPKRDGNYDYKIFNAQQGSLIIMDTALWHRAGNATKKRRWAIFNMFSSWFIKPYTDFKTIYNADEIKELSPIARQLLHFDSIPPSNHDGARATLSRIRENS